MGFFKASSDNNVMEFLFLLGSWISSSPWFETVSMLASCSPVRHMERREIKYPLITRAGSGIMMT